VAGYRHLLDTPSIPRILEMLLECEEGRDEPALVQALGDAPYATKAIDILLAHGLITREKGRVRISHDVGVTQKIHQIVSFYGDIQKAARKGLMFRGILNATYYRCLMHFGTFIDMMEYEGFDKEETISTLDEEKKQGYVQHLKIMYRSRLGLKHKFFPFIPLYYYPHFIAMDADNAQPLRARLENPGVTLAEEDYLLGNYPKELAAQSRDYILKEKNHIKEKIKNESFDVWWYYRF
jgi:hypothetical protein